MASVLERARPARTTAATRASTAGLPLASFDLLEGSFQTAVNTRLLNYLLVGVFTVMLVGVGGLGVSATLAESANHAALVQETATATAANKQLSTAAHIGNLSQAVIRQHLLLRTQQLQAATGSEPTYASILTSVAQVAPSGVTVQAIHIVPAVATAAVSPTPAATAGGQQITITASASTFATVSSWMQALAKVPALAGVQTTWSGSPGSNSIQMTSVGALQAGTTVFSQLDTTYGFTAAARSAP